MDKIPAPESKASDNLAQLRAKAEAEPIASFLKMRLLELSPGYAKIAMKLTPDYLNFNELIFGGVIMAVADQAFAYASNSTTLLSTGDKMDIKLGGYTSEGGGIGGVSKCLVSHCHDNTTED